MDGTPYEAFVIEMRARAERIGRNVLRDQIGDPFPSPTDESDGPHLEDFTDN